MCRGGLPPAHVLVSSAGYPDLTDSTGVPTVLVVCSINHMPVRTLLTASLPLPKIQRPTLQTSQKSTSTVVYHTQLHFYACSSKCIPSTPINFMGTRGRPLSRKTGIEGGMGTVG